MILSLAGPLLPNSILKVTEPLALYVPVLLPSSQVRTVVVVHRSNSGHCTVTAAVLLLLLVSPIVEMRLYSFCIPRLKSTFIGVV